MGSGLCPAVLIPIVASLKHRALAEHGSTMGCCFSKELCPRSGLERTSLFDSTSCEDLERDSTTQSGIPDPRTGENALAQAVIPVSECSTSSAVKPEMTNNGSCKNSRYPSYNSMDNTEHNGPAQRSSKTRSVNLLHPIIGLSKYEHLPKEMDVDPEQNADSHSPVLANVGNCTARVSTVVDAWPLPDHASLQARVSLNSEHNSQEVLSLKANFLDSSHKAWQSSLTPREEEKNADNTENRSVLDFFSARKQIDENLLSQSDAEVRQQSRTNTFYSICLVDNDDLIEDLSEKSLATPQYDTVPSKDSAALVESVRDTSGSQDIGIDDGFRGPNHMPAAVDSDEPEVSPRTVPSGLLSLAPPTKDLKEYSGCLLNAVCLEPRDSSDNVPINCKNYSSFGFLTHGQCLPENIDVSALLDEIKPQSSYVPVLLPFSTPPLCEADPTTALDFPYQRLNGTAESCSDSMYYASDEYIKTFLSPSLEVPLLEEQVDDHVIEDSKPTDETSLVYCTKNGIVEDLVESHNGQDVLPALEDFHNGSPITSPYKQCNGDVCVKGPEKQNHTADFSIPKDTSTGTSGLYQSPDSTGPMNSLLCIRNKQSDVIECVGKFSAWSPQLGQNDANSLLLRNSSHPIEDAESKNSVSILEAVTSCAINGFPSGPPCAKPVINGDTENGFPNTSPKSGGSPVVEYFDISPVNNSKEDLQEPKTFSDSEELVSPVFKTIDVQLIYDSHLENEVVDDPADQSHEDASLVNQGNEVLVISEASHGHFDEGRFADSCIDVDSGLSELGNADDLNGYGSDYEEDQVDQYAATPSYEIHTPSAYFTDNKEECVLDLMQDLLRESRSKTKDLCEGDEQPLPLSCVLSGEHFLVKPDYKVDYLWYDQHCNQQYHCIEENLQVSDIRSGKYAFQLLDPESSSIWGWPEMSDESVSLCFLLLYHFSCVH